MRRLSELEDFIGSPQRRGMMKEEEMFHIDALFLSLGRLDHC